MICPVDTGRLQPLEGVLGSLSHWHCGCLWWFPEAVGSVGVGGVEHSLAFLADDVVEAVVDVGWGVEADTGVAVFVVVVVEERFAERSSRSDVGEPFGEGGRVFQGFELCFGVGVVVGLVWPGVALETPRSARS